MEYHPDDPEKCNITFGPANSFILDDFSFPANLVDEAQ